MVSSKNNKQLARRMATLVEVNERLCATLQHHRSLMTQAAEDTRSGTLYVEGLMTGGAASMREELTAALDAFEVARHAVRLALFRVLTGDQGATISDIARSLGISRQLASRLFQESESQS
jgi:hypothetical protein